MGIPPETKIVPRAKREPNQWGFCKKCGKEIAASEKRYLRCLSCYPPPQRRTKRREVSKAD